MFIYSKAERQESVNCHIVRLNRCKMDQRKLKKGNLLTEIDVVNNNNPWKTIFVYMSMGLLWILFSDSLLKSIVNSQESYMLLQSYKGTFYVVVTALILYFIIKLDYKKSMDLSKEVVSKNQELISYSEELIAMEEELNQQIQSLHSTMDALNANKQFVDEIFNSSNAAIMVWNLKGEVVEVNNHFFEIFGYDGSEIIGKNGMK